MTAVDGQNTVSKAETGAWPSLLRAGVMRIRSNHTAPSPPRGRRMLRLAEQSEASRSWMRGAAEGAIKNRYLGPLTQLTSKLKLALSLRVSIPLPPGERVLADHAPHSHETSSTRCKAPLPRWRSVHRVNGGRHDIYR